MRPQTLRDLYADPVLAETAQAAIAQGLARIVPPTPKPWRPYQADPRAIAALLQCPQPYLKDEAPERDDPGRATTRQRYQDDFHYIRNPNPIGGWCDEVAQFRVGSGEAGVIRTIWTWADVRLDVAEELEIAKGSGAVTGLDPFSWLRQGRELRWYLRFFQAGHRTNVPRRFGLPPSHLPGYEWPDFPVWFDNRFGWGTPHGGVFIVVPSDTVVRLFVELLQDTASNLFNYVGGRLIGYTQPIHAKCTIQNMRHGWNW